MRVGFVGIGNMGRPMAANLAQGGHELIVADLSREAVESFTGEFDNARPANGLAALAQDSDAVITIVPNGKDVRKIALGADGGDNLADGMAEGSLLIDMSSSAPTGTVELGAEMAERGIAMVDAPVSGGVPRAIDGTLAIMVGGDAADIERCRPLLEVMGGQIFETGKLGSGHALKCLNNVMSGTHLILAAEALLIGKKFGIGSETMVDVLNFSSGKNSATEGKMNRYILNRAFNSGFSMALMMKDIDTALDLAKEMEVGWLIGGLVRNIYRAARNQLPDDADNAEVVKWLEANAGIEL
ncbi:MAG: NAD(P)-dependent oxidoreductase [Alphaproteobacteria bacterium]|nr:NAD(P)-dependent oxidoreductase [Alphaproteobacteria bacterium]